MDRFPVERRSDGLLEAGGHSRNVAHVGNDILGVPEDSGGRIACLRNVDFEDSRPADALFHSALDGAPHSVVREESHGELALRSGSPKVAHSGRSLRVNLGSIRLTVSSVTRLSCGDVATGEVLGVRCWLHELPHQYPSVRHPLA